MSSNALSDLALQYLHRLCDPEVDDHAAVEGRHPYRTTMSMRACAALSHTFEISEYATFWSLLLHHIPKEYLDARDSLNLI